MALKIRWSPTAKIRYREILDYLRNDWTDKEVAKFIHRTESVLKVVAEYPYAFKASSTKNVRKVVVGKQNSLIYRVADKYVYLLTFWDNRQDPAKSKYKIY